MKKITQEQLDAILKAFYELNAPVRTYEAVQKLFSELPTLEEDNKK